MNKNTLQNDDFVPRDTLAAPNDRKLSDGCRRHDSCAGRTHEKYMKKKETKGEVATPKRELAASMTPEPVRCSAWLGDGWSGLVHNSIRTFRLVIINAISSANLRLNKFGAKCYRKFYGLFGSLENSDHTVSGGDSVENVELGRFNEFGDTIGMKRIVDKTVRKNCKSREIHRDVLIVDGRNKRYSDRETMKYPFVLSEDENGVLSLLKARRMA